MTDDDLDARVRQLEKDVAAHIAECTQYRKSTEATLGRIEDNSVMIRNQVASNNKQMTEHLTAHTSIRGAWTDFRVVSAWLVAAAACLWELYKLSQ